MTALRTLDRRAILPGSALILITAVAWWVSSAQIDATRHRLVERRLRTAIDILREPAAAALSSTDARPAFLQDLANWGRVTGLRLTLILPNGSVLADTEVAQMPNLSDRPEVRAATEGRTHTEFRKSVMTGKDTLYVATPVEKHGVLMGTLRAATDATEIDGALAGFEQTLAVIALGCLGTGVLVGVVVGRRSRNAVVPGASESTRERIAA